ncbi:MAG TPA: hypothetical protein VKM55_03165 [Candidatus Lokiarchaeia archaeon]|nr:hypothetical protein [Candidatus Lokiarchaeia archaeon]
MNEFKVISYILARRGDEIGATDDAMIEALGLKGKDSRQQLYRLLESYASKMALFGFKVEKNPLDGHWFLSCTNDISENSRMNPFQGRTRLASTLVAILISMTCDDGEVTVDRVKKIRNVKDITQDLKELEAMGLLRVHGNKIIVLERVGYFIDLADFMKRFNDYLNEKYK